MFNVHWLPAQVLAGLPDDQRAALLAAQAEGAMTLDGVDEVSQPGSTRSSRLSLCLPIRFCHKLHSSQPAAAHCQITSYCTGDLCDK